MLLYIMGTEDCDSLVCVPVQTLLTTTTLSCVTRGRTGREDDDDRWVDGWIEKRTRQTTSHTFSSTPALSPRTGPGPSCTGARCPVQEGHRGSGLSALSRSTKELHRARARHDQYASLPRLHKQLRTFRDGQGRTPLIPQDIQADRPVRVDIRVVDLRCEADLGRLEGVVGRERDR